MNTTAKAVLFSFFSVVMFNAQANEHQHGEMMNMQPAAQQEQLISATGVIEAVDMESKKITIKHDPIPAVNWPAMTMRFTLVPIRRLMILSQAIRSRLRLFSREISLCYAIFTSVNNVLVGLFYSCPVFCERG